MSKDLEKTEALIVKVKADIENITAKKADILKRKRTLSLVWNSSKTPAFYSL